MIVVLGDFNAETKRWYPLGKIPDEGTGTDGITSEFGLEQLIHEPTQFIGGKSPGTYLRFNSQSNLGMESGLISSLHQNCHHQIVFARFNLKVVFSLPYKRGFWHFQKANVDHIRKTINRFRWEAFTCTYIY